MTLEQLFLLIKCSFRKTLLFLMNHLDHVVKHSEDNKMGVENLSIVVGSYSFITSYKPVQFGPTLCRIAVASTDIAAGLLAQNEVVRWAYKASFHAPLKETH